jgi:hypothetical protein
MRQHHVKHAHLLKISEAMSLRKKAYSAERNRYAPPWKLRYVAGVIFLVVIGVGGGKWLSSSPWTAPWQTSESSLNEWITPPAYTGLKPIILASPDGGRHEQETIDVPEGSVFSVEIPDSDSPVVLDNGSKEAPLSPGKQGLLTASEDISGSGSIALRKGWHTVDSWRVRVLRDTAPRIAFSDPPAVFDHKSTRLAFEASDDYGVKTVLARISPAANGTPPKGMVIDVVLMSPNTKHVKEVDVEDLTFLPWAGMPVDIQLVAVDGKGQKAETGKMTTTLPKREFSFPLAKALVEEREKLLRQPDELTRDEAANIMAGIARETTNYGNDPLVFMALRTGAVRLVLDRGDDALSAVCRLMWQAAARIEDNMQDKAKDVLRQARREEAK